MAMFCYFVNMKATYCGEIERKFSKLLIHRVAFYSNLRRFNVKQWFDPHRVPSTCSFLLLCAVRDDGSTQLPNVRFHNLTSIKKNHLNQIEIFVLKLFFLYTFCFFNEYDSHFIPRINVFNWLKFLV